MPSCRRKATPKDLHLPGGTAASGLLYLPGLWDEDLLAVVRDAFLRPVSHWLFPTRRAAGVCHGSRAKSSTVGQNQYSYHADWK